jgi:hypothetical protein
MLLNIVVAAWIIGSITLLIVKSDEKTGEYRDNLDSLQQYGHMHEFDDTFMSGLKSQLKLGFQNQEISDEQVLKPFPSPVRRKILRKLYLKPLLQTQLMKGVRQQFVDAFLASCKVEIFSPGEEVVERGSILSDLFLLVGGIAEATDIGFHPPDVEQGKGSGFDSDRIKFEAGDCTCKFVDRSRWLTGHVSHNVSLWFQLLGRLDFSPSRHKSNRSLVSPSAKL